MRLRTVPWIVLSDVGPLAAGPPDVSDPSDAASNDLDPSFSDPTPAQAATTAKSNAQPQGRRESHVAYLRYLQRRQPAKTPIEVFGAGYQDYLQNPLQPLADNLESVTYEVFEKDPIKYEWYERAIAAALADWEAQELPGSGPEGKITVAVVGAGRGPLVTGALQASESTGIAVDLWALEKNQNAFVLLQQHNVDKWAGRVSLVQSDMRQWKGPSMTVTGGLKLPDGYESQDDSDDDMPRTEHYTVDIVVSELLGSFADNELSPECLDGVQHVLNPVHGISIPSSYTAHLTPVAAPKLHADIMSRSASGDVDATQIPYVVLLQAIDYLASSSARDSLSGQSGADVQTAWEFVHPLQRPFLTQAARHTGAEWNAHNKRQAHLTFHCPLRGACHGIAGYFETVLYAPTSGAGGVELSTNPLTIERKSRDMISWFPIYFPLKVRHGAMRGVRVRANFESALQTPLYVPDGSELEVSMWRQTDGRKVWYEWMVESFATLGGSQMRRRIGSSELHSSINNGCLL